VSLVPELNGRWSRQQEVALVTMVLLHPAKFDLDLFGLMNIRTTEQETIEVSWSDSSPKVIGLQVKSFPLARLVQAVEFFVQKRHERKLGEEYETDA
jgi:hypothetical protein